MKRNHIEKIQKFGALIYFVLINIPFAGAVMQQRGMVEFSVGARQIELIGNSLKLSAIVTGISVVLGFFCALYIYNSKKINGWKQYYFILLLPIPFYIYALSWMYLIKLLAMIWPAISKYSISGIGACIFVETLAYFPIAILFMLIGMKNINVDTLCVASIYGTDNKAVKKIIIREVAPYAAAAAGLISTLSLTGFSVPSMFQYNTYALDIFSVYSRTGSALTAYCRCVPLILILIVPIMWLIKNIRQLGVQNSVNQVYYLKPAKGIKLLSQGAFLLSLLQIIVPVVVFVFTTGGLHNLFSGCGMVLEELNISFWTSFFGAVFCILISGIPADYLRNQNSKIPCLMLYTIAVPGTIQAMGLLKVVNRYGWIAFQKSIFMTSLGCALKMAPFMILWLWISKMRINNKAVELAEIFAPKKRDAVKIKMRLLAPGYLAGFAMAFFMIFAEEGIPLILMAPGKETITVKIYNYLHYGASEHVSAFSVAVLVFIFFMEVLSVFLYRALIRKKK